MSKGTILFYVQNGRGHRIPFRQTTVRGVIQDYRIRYAKEGEPFAINNFDYLLASDYIVIAEVTYHDGGRTFEIAKKVEFSPDEFFAEIGFTVGETESMRATWWYSAYVKARRDSLARENYAEAV